MPSKLIGIGLLVWLMSGILGCHNHGFEISAMDDAGKLDGFTFVGISTTSVSVAEHKQGFGLFDQDGNRVERLEVRPGEKFNARGFNRDAIWKLMEISNGHALFDVVRRCWGCTDVFAICTGIPSGTYYFKVVVCPHACGSQAADQSDDEMKDKEAK